MNAPRASVASVPPAASAAIPQARFDWRPVAL